MCLASPAVAAGQRAAARAEEDKAAGLGLGRCAAPSSERFLRRSSCRAIQLSRLELLLRKVVAPRRKPSPSTVVAPRRKLGFRAISTGNDAHDQVLTEAYEPDITQRAFVGAVLAEDATIRPKTAQDWWRSQRMIARADRDDPAKPGRRYRRKDRLKELTAEAEASTWR